MKKTKLILIITIILSIITITNINAEEIKINSNNGILYNVNDNKILYTKNEKEKVSIASLTKMMTALVAIENINDINEKVTFQKQDYNNLLQIDASSSSLDYKKEYTYDDLLHGLLMESGADCANALARLTKGNTKNFVKEMNKKAKELGMNNTSFSNPIGMDSKYNYSTMEDLTILFKAGLKNITFKKIITTLEYTLSDRTNINHTIKFYEKLDNIDIPYIKGGKTGYETNSGYALATIAYKKGTTLMFISSNAKKRGDHLKDAKKVYDYYFDNYDYQTIIKKGETIKTLNTKYLNQETINITSNEDIKYYLKNDYNKNDINIIYDGLDEIDYTNKYMSKIGTLSIYYKKELVKTTPVYLNQKTHPDYRLIILACITYIFIIGTTIIIVNRLKKKRMLEQI